MTNEDLQRLAVAETQVRDIRDDLAELKRDMRAVRETLDQAKGGWKTLVAVGGFAGAIGAGLAKLIGH